MGACAGCFIRFFLAEGTKKTASFLGSGFS